MATLHVARRTIPHHPLTGLRERWNTFQLRHFRRVQTAYFTQLHDALPLDDPDRHALEAPALEDAFACLAAAHPEAVTPADGGALARDTDREQLLLAACDAWFRDAHGPEHRWSPRTIAKYDRLMADVRGCFHPGGAA
ncbi:hypothetical protein [Streptomyces sp. NBC_00996]|uniref:hypothetical protein n=1 Tax=Streptomyces sp. NBC_00996 TaxID=2903710 RepID=UPI00386503F8|nr:hypothetical protein OG390_17465 [Streptomyces sp. NBC_00996]